MKCKKAFGMVCLDCRSKGRCKYGKQVVSFAKDTEIRKELYRRMENGEDVSKEPEYIRLETVPFTVID